LRVHGYEEGGLWDDVDGGRFGGAVGGFDGSIGAVTIVVWIGFRDGRRQVDAVRIRAARTVGLAVGCAEPEEEVLWMFARIIGDERLGITTILRSLAAQKCVDPWTSGARRAV
jgi:hypothetical protein